MSGDSLKRGMIIDVDFNPTRGSKIDCVLFPFRAIKPLFTATLFARSLPFAKLSINQIRTDEIE